MKYFGVAAVMIAVSVAPALAFDDADRAAVAKSFETLAENSKSENIPALVDSMPPKILEKMAEPTGMDVAVLKPMIVEQLKQAMSQVSIGEFTYDLDAMQSGTSDAGRSYAVVPTSVVMEISGASMKADGPTLALEDGDQWYLLQVQSPDQKQLLATAYPDLADVDLPVPTVTPIE